MNIVYFKFEKLKVWQRAIEQGEEIFKMTKRFPPDELYSLSSQMRRVMDSVALNIAEGAVDQTNPEQRRFISYSLRSICEVVTCLYKAKKRIYINESEFDLQYKKANELFKMLLALKKSLK